MPAPILSRALRYSTLSLILLLAFTGITGCSSDDSSGGMFSPPDWVVIPSGGRHARSATLTYIANGGISSCEECHGADLSGGNTNVSCFENPAGCHHGPVAGWVASPPATQNHGVAAKRAPGSSGFASCQICHGEDFSGGGSLESCFPCHEANAPHPASPWVGSLYTHITTDTENAPVCAQCHFPGSPNNPENQPAEPAPAGTPPGCFNSTLCHDSTTAPHALGAAWRDPNPLFHGLAAKQDLSYCQQCHGTPGTTLFNGGTAPTSCQTSTCHAGAKAHPVPWHQAPQPFPAYVGSHRDSGNHTVACAICHTVDGPGTGPEPNAPSCFADSSRGTLCHPGGPGVVTHSVPFPGAAHTTADQTSFDASCSACHAIAGASPNSLAPACTVCHRAGSPLTSPNCASCHGDPPSGVTYPDVAGKHAVHGALPGVGACTPCHNGLDAGTPEHYDRANARPGMDALRVPPGDIAFLAEYNAQSGAASFAAGNRTCSNVICHGGQETPDWQTVTADAIDVPNACLACHVSGTTQHNSYNSGSHDVHITVFGLAASTCLQCHDVAKVNVAGHFQNLATPAFEQPASETILPDVRYNGNNCNPQAGGLTGCHSSRPW